MPLFANSSELIMKKSSTLICAALSGLLMAAPALADQKLAAAKNCMSCHAADKKLVGPSYKDVAAKYAGQRDAVDKLAVKIIKGGSGAWGPVPMPSNAQVSQEEARQLVSWILTQK
jgi:cytochrome c